MVAILQADTLSGGIARDHVPTTIADGLPVDAYFDQNGRLITAAKVAVGTQTSVASSTGDTTLLSANHARLGATIHNDSTQMLYILLANATCTTAVYSVSILADGYYEVPYGYIGIVKGTWYAPNGFARVTELT